MVITFIFFALWFRKHTLTESTAVRYSRWLKEHMWLIIKKSLHFPHKCDFLPLFDFKCSILWKMKSKGLTQEFSHEFLLVQ